MILYKHKINYTEKQKYFILPNQTCKPLQKTKKKGLYKKVQQINECKVGHIKKNFS